MPPFDRDGALKTAEKALRQGRIDAAIAEYLKVVEAQPRDWNSANALGDLFVRAGQVDKGLAQYTRIADHMAGEGFYPKAAALYKKIIKIKPGEEAALLQLGDIASRQGLLADAKQYFNQLVERRRARGDQKGAAELVIRVGTLDPDDLEARLTAARTAAQIGDVVTALDQFRDVGSRLLEAGREEDYINVLVEVAALDPADLDTAATLARAFVGRGDLGRARPFLSPETAGDDPALWLALAECTLGENQLDEGRIAAETAVRLDPARRETAVAMGCRLAEQTPEAGYQVIDVVADAALRDEDYAAAAAALHEFVTRVRFHLVALMRLVEICVDGQLEATMFEAQAQLADAYLEVGRGLEARIISEDLVAREPWNRANIERFRKSLVMLGEADPDAIIADRLSGDSPFMAADFIDLNEGMDFSTAADEHAVESSGATTKAGERRRRGKSDTSGATAGGEGGAQAVGQSGDASSSADSTRRERAQKTVAVEEADTALDDEAAEQYRLALTYQDMGMTDDAIHALELAARSPRQRFDAASMLGRLHVERQDLDMAVQWFERASVSPAPTPDAGRALLYDLASALEATRQGARALAVFVELETESGGYRDVAVRIARLSKVQARG